MNVSNRTQPLLKFGEKSGIKQLLNEGMRKNKIKVGITSGCSYQSFRFVSVDKMVHQYPRRIEGMSKLGKRRIGIVFFGRFEWVDASIGQITLSNEAEEE